MTITITGASGFVGQNLQKYLQERQYNIKKVCVRKLVFSKQTLTILELDSKIVNL